MILIDFQRILDESSLVLSVNCNILHNAIRVLSLWAAVVAYQFDNLLRWAEGDADGGDKNIKQQFLLRRLVVLQNCVFAQEQPKNGHLLLSFSGLKNLPP